jgi:hypothetical protein
MVCIRNLFLVSFFCQNFKACSLLFFSIDAHGNEGYSNECANDGDSKEADYDGKSDDCVNYYNESSDEDDIRINYDESIVNERSDEDNSDKGSDEDDENSYEDSCGAGDNSDSAEEMDSAKEMECNEEGKGNFLRWILAVFFRVMFHFNISSNAASSILSFFSLVLGRALRNKVHDHCNKW